MQYPFEPKYTLCANSIFQIQLYRGLNAWVFDDVERNIVHEPFVRGATELIDFHLERKGIKSEKPILQFSKSYIPHADIVLTCVNRYTRTGLNEGDFSSGDFIDQSGNQCWLCPAQLAFFGEVPDEIYVMLSA